MAIENVTGTARKQPAAPVGEEIPHHQMAELFDWVEKGRVDQVEETLRQRLEYL